ncbi:FRIGIDA-like protein [Quillaja saponaria]|uniref:FRIGIDA-like protein n=1 Tax=Quillaja saponaria TaxID=32244 RepID=A0AAD7VFG7_QUISA|nr:FRIGIDA-like protein [Quillaja saponaria]
MGLCGVLIQTLFPEMSSGGKAPEISRSIVERAAACRSGGVVEGAFGAAEAVMFLQTVVGFRLLLRKLVMEFLSRRDVAKLAAA